MGRIRKIIENGIKKLNLKRYIFYALGEIILIVVGVLIAVNINNYNDEVKKEEKLNFILGNISQDLESDVKNLENLIAEYEERDSIIMRIIGNEYSQNYFDTINKENFLDCEACFAYHIGFQTFSPKLDGYNQLKDFSLGSIILSEKLSHNILFFYKQSLSGISLIEESLANTTLTNISSLEEFEWYSDFMFNKYNPKAISYFQNNLTYKNRLVTFRLLAIENHLSILKQYSIQAEELLKIINKKNQ